jgi:hypothetical protein
MRSAPRKQSMAARPVGAMRLAGPSSSADGAARCWLRALPLTLTGAALTVLVARRAWPLTLACGRGTPGRQ